MKNRRRSLTFKILLPTLLAVFLIEVGAYVGAVITMNNTAYQDAVITDREVLLDIKDNISADQADIACGSVVDIYEKNKPETLPASGSQAEKEYRDAFSSASGDMPYLALESMLNMATLGNSTDYLGVYYVDASLDRFVASCLSYGSATGTTPKTSSYIGFFFHRKEFMKGESFYGQTIEDPNYGRFFTSGVKLTGSATNEYWIIKETKESFVYSMWPTFSWQYAIVALSALALLSAITYFLIGRLLIRPINAISLSATRYVDSMKHGQTKDEFSPSTAKHLDELTDLNDSFYSAQEAIKDYVAAIHDASQREQRYQAELMLAEKLQESMVPKKPLSGPDFLLNGFMKPAREVGGDLYGYFEIDKDHVGFFIGDVSGKGVPAALFMAKACAVLRSSTPTLDVERANKTLCESNSEEYFVTAFIATLELSTGILRYVNCGHETPFLCHDGVYSPLSENPNFMLGYVDDFKFVQEECRLSKGDRLILYTDGVSEAMDKDGNLFGRERIQNAMNEVPDLPSQEAIPVLMRRINEFVKGAEQSDDACVMCLDYGSERVISFESRKEEVGRVAEFIDKCLAEEDPEYLALIQVSLDELVSNIVFYSQMKNPARLILRKEKDGYCVILVDDGVPFNPLMDRKPRDEDMPGGHGINMVQSFMDEVSYRRLDDKNILTIRKKTK